MAERPRECCRMTQAPDTALPPFHKRSCAASRSLMDRDSTHERLLDRSAHATHDAGDDVALEDLPGRTSADEAKTLLEDELDAESAVGQHVHWTHEEERQLVRKLDLLVMPLLVVAFFALQLDRGKPTPSPTSRCPMMLTQRRQHRQRPDRLFSARHRDQTECIQQGTGVAGSWDRVVGNPEQLHPLSHRSFRLDQSSNRGMGSCGNFPGVPAWWVMVSVVQNSMTEMMAYFTRHNCLLYDSLPPRKF